MTDKPTLDEPVVISKFWKNRRHDAVIVSLSTYEGHNLVEVRRLPELHQAVTKALAKARELGLIEQEEPAE